MLFITRESLEKLPILYGQSGIKDPMVYIKVVTPDNSWAAYLIEGRQIGEDYTILGLFIGLLHTKRRILGWQQLLVSSLEKNLKIFGINAVQDLSFEPQRLSLAAGITRNIQEKREQ